MSSDCTTLYFKLCHLLFFFFAVAKEKIKFIFQSSKDHDEYKAPKGLVQSVLFLLFSDILLAGHLYINMFSF